MKKPIYLHNVLLLCALGAFYLNAHATEPTIREIYDAAENNKYDQADAMLSELLRLHPDSAKIHYVEAQILAKEGHIDAAKAELGKAESLNPGLDFVRPDQLQTFRALLSRGSTDRAAKRPSAGQPESPDQALLQSIKFGQVQALRDALKNGGNPAATDGAGVPAVIMAIRTNNVELLRVLMEAQPKVANQTYKTAAGDWHTPLIESLLLKKVEMTTALLDAGADINWVDNNGLDALSYVVFGNDVDDLKILIAKGADPKKSVQRHGTLLHLAAAGDHPEMIDALINLGVSPNKRDDFGIAPLTVATSFGQLGSAKALLAGGAWVYPIDTFGETALSSAKHNIKDADKLAQATQLLVSHGARPDNKNRPIDDAYLLAVHRGDLAAVKAALNNGADINAHNIATLDLPVAEPASIAVQYPTLLAYLIDRGIDLTASNRFGLTALNYAVTKGVSAESIKILVAHGLNVNQKASNGITPLYSAVNLNLPNAVETLLQLGADPNTHGPSGGSLLQMARENNRSTLIATMLLKAGAKDVQ